MTWRVRRGGGAYFSLSIGVISVLASISGCADGQTAQPVAGATSQPAPTVEVFRVVAEPLPERIPVVGTLYAAEEVTISTKAAGILRRAFVDVGAVVAPGAPLAQVDRLDYEVAVKQAEAALAEALARLGTDAAPGPDFDRNSVSTVARATAQLQSARFSYERLQQLSRVGMAPVSEQELNDALTELRVAEANQRLAVDEAAALIATAQEREALLQISQQRLANTLTQAPPIPSTLGQAGAEEWVVSARLITEGQYLDVANPLYRLIVRDPLKLRCKVPERYAGLVKIGQTVNIRLIEGLARPSGRIERISPAGDPASRTFEIEALVDNGAGDFLPGAFVTGELVADDQTPRALVPVDAIVTGGGVTRVFVVEGDRVQQRDVEVGRQVESRVEILAGLQAGELIVARGGGALRDGAIVQVRAAESSLDLQ